MTNHLKNILERYRGVQVREINLENEEFCSVLFSCACNSSLAALSSFDKDEVWIEVEGVHQKNIYFVLYRMNFDTKSIDSITKLISSNLTDDIDELFEEIDVYNKLIPASKQKYIDFVKHVRDTRPDGFSYLNANELLEEYREWPLSSEIQMILESGNPIEADLKLEEIAYDEAYSDDDEEEDL